MEAGTSSSPNGRRRRMVFFAVAESRIEIIITSAQQKLPLEAGVGI
jgi:hypothetical protein